MRHRVLGKKLNRSSAHRQSMERNFICSVIKHERVVTTLAKAKAMRRNLEKMITLGKTKDLTRYRRAIAFLRDEGGLEGGESLLEKREHLPHDVVVVGGLLHFAGVALHVHDDETCVARGGEREHVGVAAEAGDVVDDRGTCGEGGAGDGGLRRVDGERAVPTRVEFGNGWEDARKFLFGADGGGSGAGRLAPDIDDFRAFSDHFEPVLDGGGWFLKVAAV